MGQRHETIRAKRLVTGYVDKHRKITITTDIDTSLYSGELTCLLGPNGAGKSTLLKALSGFLPPLSGDIVINGKSLSDYKDSELARVIGVVLTERIRLANMSAYELVAMGRSPYTGFWGHLHPRDKEIINEAFSLVNIYSLRDCMFNTLSDGERQKVMIAKALAQETPIIFLDEPTAFLDYPSKVEIMQLLQNLSRTKQKTVFLSTHDLELALQIADKIWLIDKQLGVRTGTPEDLAEEGLLGKYFEREGIVFDLESGLFRIDHKLTRDIRLEGEGVRCNLVRKALARNGIRAGKDICSLEKIVVSDKDYTYFDHKYDTIEALLDVILQNNPNDKT